MGLPGLLGTPALLPLCAATVAYLAPPLTGRALHWPRLAAVTVVDFQPRMLPGSTPPGPVGRAQALGTAAVAVATTATAVAPRLLTVTRVSSKYSRGRSTTWTTPARQSTAYSSRNGSTSNREMASVNGSAPDTPSRDTSSTFGKAFVQTTNST